MKGIYWQTLTFKKSVIYLIKVNYTSYVSSVSWRAENEAAMPFLQKCDNLVYIVFLDSNPGPFLK